MPTQLSILAVIHTFTSLFSIGMKINCFLFLGESKHLLLLQELAESLFPCFGKCSNTDVRRVDLDFNI